MPLKWFLPPTRLKSSLLARRSEAKEPMMTTTRWQITPSVPYEVLCFLNVLTGDPFYTSLYQAEYEHWAPQLSPDIQAALAHIKRVIKDEKSSIISAELCLLFSSLPDLTLSILVDAVTERDALYRAYQQSRH